MSGDGGERFAPGGKLPSAADQQQAELDQPAVLHPWNAPENAPMIAVNERLGRAVDHRVAFELGL
jgi:hypothetical protein